MPDLERLAQREDCDALVEHLAVVAYPRQVGVGVGNGGGVAKHRVGEGDLVILVVILGTRADGPTIVQADPEVAERAAVGEVEVARAVARSHAKVVRESVGVLQADPGQRDSEVALDGVVGVSAGIVVSYDTCRQVSRPDLEGVGGVEIGLEGVIVVVRVEVLVGEPGAYCESGAVGDVGAAGESHRIRASDLGDTAEDVVGRQSDVARLRPSSCRGRCRLCKG